MNKDIFINRLIRYIVYFIFILINYSLGIEYAQLMILFFILQELTLWKK